jgi:hypothetical protein
MIFEFRDDVIRHGNIRRRIADKNGADGIPAYDLSISACGF